jgi:beta-lactamase class A
VGIYVRHLRSRRTAMLRADATFPDGEHDQGADLIGEYDALARGRTSTDSDRHCSFSSNSLRYRGRRWLIAMLPDSARVPLSRLIPTMVSFTRQHRVALLQRVVGGATINAWLAAHGYDSTRVNSRTPAAKPIARAGGGARRRRARWRGCS